MARGKVIYSFGIQEGLEQFKLINRSVSDCIRLNDTIENEPLQLEVSKCICVEYETLDKTFRRIFLCDQSGAVYITSGATLIDVLEEYLSLYKEDKPFKIWLSKIDSVKYPGGKTIIPTFE